MSDSGSQPKKDADEALLAEVLTSDSELWTTVDTFVRTLPVRAEALQDAMRDGSFERMRAIAHHLKTGGAQCGYQNLCDRAAAIEQAAHEHLEDGLAGRIHELTTLIHKIHASIRAQDA